MRTLAVAIIERSNAIRWIDKPMCDVKKIGMEPPRHARIRPAVIRAESVQEKDVTDLLGAGETVRNECGLVRVRARAWRIGAPQRVTVPIGGIGRRSRRVGNVKIHPRVTLRKRPHVRFLSNAIAEKRMHTVGGVVTRVRKHTAVPIAGRDGDRERAQGRRAVSHTVGNVTDFIAESAARIRGQHWQKIVEVERRSHVHAGRTSPGSIGINEQLKRIGLRDPVRVKPGGILFAARKLICGVKPTEDRRIVSDYFAFAWLKIDRCGKVRRCGRNDAGFLANPVSSMNGNGHQDEDGGDDAHILRGACRLGRLHFSHEGRVT